MAAAMFIWPGFAVCFLVVTFLSLSQKQADIVLRRLRVRKGRIGTHTPPRSLSPEKPLSKPLASSALDVAATFPPSQRERLQQLFEALPEHGRKAVETFNRDRPATKKSILGFEEEYSQADPSTWVCSDLYVDEIKALGDFPDYSALTDVPLPRPYRDFDIDKARPRPYRPFRWAYHQTMSLTKLEPDWWIELENTYRDRITQRKDLFANYGGDVLQWLPGSELACKELMEMIVQFLCARYPHYFSLSEDKSELMNKILDTVTNLRDRHPLLTLLENVPEDFAIMLRNPETGLYHFRAGMICSALGWNVGTKIGMQLHEIHGPIPDYKEKMQFSMDRFFTKMPASKPIQRGSWGLEVDEPLYMPPGDPHELYRERQDPSLTLDRMHLRVDWQTLRRLPLSGAIVFNFKALFTPVTEFRDEAHIPSLILKVINEGKENLMKYKNTWHTEHVVKPALEQYQKEQIQRGIIEKDWEVKTLDESPFFPNWDEKWHRQQGF